MTIKLYKNSADNRRVDKSSEMTLIRSFDDCSFKRSNSIMDVSITIYIENRDVISGANYVYIPELQTYYYIDDVEYLTANRVQFYCHEDVLMTYKKDILKLNCVIARQENKYNTYLDDDRFRVYSNKRIQTKIFPSGFNKNNCSYILTIAGGE